MRLTGSIPSSGWETDRKTRLPSIRDASATDIERNWTAAYASAVSNPIRAADRTRVVKVGTREHLLLTSLLLLEKKRVPTHRRVGSTSAHWRREAPRTSSGQLLCPLLLLSLLTEEHAHLVLILALRCCPIGELVVSDLLCVYCKVWVDG